MGIAVRGMQLAAFMAVVAAMGSSLACLRAAPVSSGPSEAERVERGRYLVQVTGCGDCHTPLTMGANGPEPDPGHLLAGHPGTVEMGVPPALGEGGWQWAGSATNTAFAGPWGVSYAPNLTPDEESGLGFWTEEMFIAAMRTGRKFGSGRPLKPPMPWPAYSQLTDEDLKAVFTYLRSVPPIVNHVPQ